MGVWGYLVTDGRSDVGYNGECDANWLIGVVVVLSGRGRDPEGHYSTDTRCLITEKIAVSCGYS